MSAYQAGSGAAPSSKPRYRCFRRCCSDRLKPPVLFIGVGSHMRGIVSEKSTYMPSFNPLDCKQRLVLHIIYDYGSNVRLPFKETV